AMMIHLLVNSFTSLIRGLGKPNLEMKIIIGLTVFILIPALFIGIRYFGLKGAAYAILINKMALATIGLFVLNREVNLTLAELCKAIQGAFIVVLFDILSVLFIKQYVINTYIVIGLIVVFFAVYLLTMSLFERKNLMKIFNQIRR